MVIWTLFSALVLLSGVVSLVGKPCTGPASAPGRRDLGGHHPPVVRAVVGSSSN